MFFFCEKAKCPCRESDVLTLGRVWGRVDPLLLCGKWPEPRSIQRSERKQKGEAFGIPLIVLYLKRCGGDTRVLMHMHTQRKVEARVALFKPLKQQTDGNYRTNQRLKRCITLLPQPPLHSLAFRDSSKRRYRFSSVGTLGNQRPLEITYRQNVQAENYIPQGGTDIQMEYLNNHPRLSKFLKRFQRFCEKFWHIGLIHSNSSREPVRMAPPSTCNHQIIYGEMVTSALLEMLQKCGSLSFWRSPLTSCSTCRLFIIQQTNQQHPLLLGKSVVTSICPTGTCYYNNSGNGAFLSV